MLSLLAFKKWFPEKYFTYFYGVILLVCAVTIIFHLLLIKAAASRPLAFMNKFIAFTGIKLLLYLIVIAGYLIIVGIQPVSFVMVFLFSYFIFTSFEVISILEHLKKNSS